jgi:imidazolonepropionase-like amidohydrolase
VRPLAPGALVAFDTRMSSPPASGALAATTLVTPIGEPPVRGADATRVLEIPNGAVAWEDGAITFVGPADELTGVAADRFDGCTIAPGFVD